MIESGMKSGRFFKKGGTSTPVRKKLLLLGGAGNKKPQAFSQPGAKTFKSFWGAFFQKGASYTKGH
jgi:hypothetical protein